MPTAQHDRGTPPKENSTVLPTFSISRSISYALPGEAKLPTLIPNRYWQLFNDPGFSPSAINPGPSVVMVEAFLGLTHQVQAMVGIMQANIPHIPQLVQQTMPLEPITQPAPQQ
ncbi:hypothetical protein BHM03_00057008 [Ensete ventricosum]|nr:hypothetical protein BHM03_00057008 [Ensete ventricosum]